MKVAWGDLSNVQEAGRYPFRDGFVTVLEMEIAIWRSRPNTLFNLMRKHPIRDQIEYVLGEHESPKGAATDMLEPKATASHLDSTNLVA